MIDSEIPPRTDDAKRRASANESDVEAAPGAIFQCIPNFSEGRDPAVIEAIADAVRGVRGALLIDYSADVDHNRCVLTILGSGAATHRAALAAARIAVGAIDLRAHSGVHPRIGAIDVLPVVPLLSTGPSNWGTELAFASEGRPAAGPSAGSFIDPARLDVISDPYLVGAVQSAGMPHAVAVAEEIGAALSSELDLPVYFYEGNARPWRAGTLPDLRKGGFEAIRDAELTGDRAPDLGPNRAHPTAGVTVVGARGPLVAYNVNLGTADVEIARTIARRIRAERNRLPELTGVRALGLFLASRGRAQVSLNLTRPDQSPLPAVFAFIAHEAARMGVDDLESEIIGALSAGFLAGATPESIRWHAYNPNQILET